MDLLTIVTLGNSVVEISILILLVKWYALDKRVAKRRPRRQKKEPTVVVQTVIPKETE